MAPIEKMYLWFLFLAYTAMFVIMFGFLLRMLKKSKELEREVRMLQEELRSSDSSKEGSTAASVSPSVRGRGFTP